MKKLILLLTVISLTSCDIWLGNDYENWKKDIEASQNSNITIDLPEEYSQATSNDTLIAIKRNDTLFVQFNNK